MTLRECLQLAKDAGFDGIELNYDLDNDLSPKCRHAKELHAIRKHGRRRSASPSAALCSFLFWPYSLTSNDPAVRERGLELGRANDPGGARPGHREPPGRAGAVHIPCASRTTTRFPPTSATAGPARAIGNLLPLAEKLGV